MSDAMATRMPRVCSVRRSWRLPVALVTAVVVAEAAVFLMRPRDRGPDPVPVEARAYFSEAQIEKAKDFRSGQLLIYLAQTAIGLGVLVVLVRHPPELLAGLRRPVVAAAGGAVLVFGMRRFRSRWWIPGAVVVVAFGAISVYAGPVVLDPLFNDF